ncbi:MAG: radical SAM protein [Thermoplasmata archaeon]|nr:MAG: radical SAM protein [Thermoplasmata archaeon]
MITLLDGFVDEPSCLGVPPYISPHARYIAGAIKDAGAEYEYMTIEEWRKGRRVMGDVLVILAGAIVPGRYLRAMPMSFKEFVEICRTFRGTTILTGAAAKFGFGQGGGISLRDGSRYAEYVAREDGDAFVYDFLNGVVQDRRRTEREWRKWSIYGADVVVHHPDYPQPLIAEMETYRGCVRWFTGGCSFCMEPCFGKPIMRKIEDIVGEVMELRKHGVVNFRMGGQSCFFSYRAMGIGKREIPQPNPAAIQRLLEGVSKTNPAVLHIDNVNPAVVSEWENESMEIAEMIKKYCTPGNTAAFGMESADKDVIRENNLNAEPWQVMNAIRIINMIGGERGENGMPHFLPGINIVYGLKKESKATYSENFAFLKSVVDSGYLIRRINIRQVVALRGKRGKVDAKLFRKFKREVNEQVNKKMLEQLLPKGTILKRVYLEIHRGNHTIGRQIGSYPVVVHLPYKEVLNRFVDVKVLSTGYKSVEAMEYPLNINYASFNALCALPTIGEKRAARIIKNKPFKNIEELRAVIDDRGENNEKEVGEESLEKYITF